MDITERRKISSRIISAALAALMLAAVLPFLGVRTADAASFSASGKTTDVVNVRKKPTTASKSLGTVKKNTSVSISMEVFTGITGTAASKRWYYVTAGNKKGYIRADLIKNISYSGVQAVTTDELNYRKGPATTFKKLGAVPGGTPVTLLMPAKRKGSGELWYRAKVGGRNAFVISTYISTGAAAASAGGASAADLSGRSELARKLLSNPTNGGSMRIVGTFGKNNCKKRFSVTGYKGNVVPQGMTFNGSEYYIVFGMSDGQSMVTYSKDGRRLRASKFSFNMGHPNGITWDPVTRMCYIFRGNTTRIYTWNPASNKFGKSGTPYSSSGLSYDPSTGFIYATSRTGIRVYSADGKFTHQRLFSRCSHRGTHYIQDCGARDGFIFHGVSGADKHSVNYLDVYRAADGKYLGSIQINLGETESVIVNDEGYVELLINHKGTHTEYVWQTPLNVNELK